ncbi:hypothetical protein M378DRAFT_457656 [Amanita muscaria Koide BX008]|uniref:Terpene synthase n=1 Tax=Amanita muscaria (strain Koide BX008) TaxID=946122 RepID=A0A0C2TFR0_AMAMK|nr:hypothetical protein M378DRAFT_457656 [Amanita muscaria Koide BX008]
MPTAITKAPSSFVLPDLVSYCTYPLRINPHLHEQAHLSEQWLLSGARHKPKKRVAFMGLKGAALAAACYPDADASRLRVIADFINYLFNLDDWLDEFDVDSTGSMEECCIGAMRDPINFQTDTRAGTLTKSFFGRFNLTAGPDCSERFIYSMQLFFRAATQQASDRMNNDIPDLESYIACRRDTSACKPCFQLIEYAGGFELPEEVLQHPIIQSLEEATNDLVTFSNDVFSYNVEQSRHDTHNMVAVMMNEMGLSLQEAVDLAGDYCKASVDRFEHDRQLLRSWGPEIDAMVDKYVDGLQNWIIGSLHWSFDTERYFGKQGLEIKRHQVVQLLPKRTK